jgi:hypothetical protein
MTTYFVWIESTSSPPPRGSHRRLTFAVEELPSGPVTHLEGFDVAEEKTEKRCELLRLQNGIRVTVDGEHTTAYIIDRALAKVAQRHRTISRDIK